MTRPPSVPVSKFKKGDFVKRISDEGSYSLAGSWGVVTNVIETKHFGIEITYRVLGGLANKDRERFATCNEVMLIRILPMAGYEP